MSIREITVKIGAGLSDEFAFKGNYVRVKVAPYVLTIENMGSLGRDVFTMSEGEDVNFNGDFERLRITNNGVADAFFVLVIAKDAKVNSAKLTGNVTINNSGAATQNRVSLTNVNQQILAANAGRKYLMIQNNDASAVMRVKIDGNAATAGQGFRIPANGTYAFDGFNVTGAINCIMETATGAAGNVEYAEA